MSNAYEKAGVNLNAGYESVERIKKHIAKTNRFGSMGSIGSFGGLFDLSKLKVKEPVLVSGTDGVGTKLIIAQLLNKHDTVGIDLVAMCVNDILAQGAEPLFFLDYIAVGKNNPAQIEELVKGVSDGCVLAGCALVGGETAEMPDLYKDGDYDLAGFAVGVAEKSKLMNPANIKAGDLLMGIPSSGIHSNGYSLVRKILFKDHQFKLDTPFLDHTLGSEILTPTKIYVKPVLDVLRSVDVKGIVHVTGGGFDENVPRILNENQGATIKLGSWPVLEIFTFLQEQGKIPKREMYQIFNMGIGMILAIDPKDETLVKSILKSHQEEAYTIGVVTHEKGIEIK